jgi:hypothetical protein
MVRGAARPLANSWLRRYFVKHDLKESVEVFMGRNLDPRQGERRLALRHRRHRPAKLPLTDVTDRLNDPVTEVTDRLKG